MNINAAEVPVTRPEAPLPVRAALHRLSTRYPSARIDTHQLEGSDAWLIECSWDGRVLITERVFPAFFEALNGSDVVLDGVLQIEAEDRRVDSQWDEAV